MAKSALVPLRPVNSVSLKKSGSQVTARAFVLAGSLAAVGVYLYQARGLIRRAYHSIWCP